MKKPIFVLLLIISLSGGLQVSSLELRHGGHDQTSHVAKYEVTNSNETALNSWFTEDYSQSWIYQVEIGSEIEVEIDDPTNINTALNITIGNLTSLDESDLNIENNLGIGYWQLPKVLGFISTSDWVQLETNMSEVGFTTFEFDDEAMYTFGAATYPAVNITFADSFQSTTLSYNKATGLLYHADIVIFNFILEFDITGYIPYETEFVESSESLLPLSVPIFSLLVVFSLITIRKKD